MATIQGGLDILRVVFLVLQSCPDCSKENGVIVWFGVKFFCYSFALLGLVLNRAEHPFLY